MKPVVDAKKLSKEHLAMAYRKAKADLYYSNDPRHLDILAYEDGLERNLERLATLLRDALRGDEVPWLTSEEFIGGFTLMGKALSVDSRRDDESGAAADSTQHRFGSVRAEESHDAGMGAPYTVDFRVLSQCSIDFHVLSALWLGIVGAKLERILDIAPMRWSTSEENGAKTSASFGNCLRRDGGGGYNWYSIGSFRPYAHQYRQWQACGFKAAETALNAEMPLTVVSADISRFFPSIDAEFLEDQTFLADLRHIELDIYESRLNCLFVRALKAWQTRTAHELFRMSAGNIDTQEIEVGLPIGLPASGLIANLALARFDRTVRERLNPLFYGRYVDDIFIVLRRDSELQTSDQVWAWMERKFAFDPAGRFEVNRSEGHITEVSYTPWSGIAGRFSFSPEKSRCYFLAGAGGRLLLSSLKSSMQARASEWRALPDVPAASEDVGATLISATTSEGSDAETLSQTARLAATRASFAVRLRDYEALAKDLPADAWSEHRKEFLRTTTEYLFALPRVVEFERFIPRLLQLAVLTGEWREFMAQINAFLRAAQGLVETRSSARINGGYDHEFSIEELSGHGYGTSSRP